MSDRALKGLVGALVVVAALWGVATLLSQGSGRSAPEASGEIDGFFADIGPSTSARWTSPLGEFTLQKAGDGWTVNGLAADSGTVARFWQTLRFADIDTGWARPVGSPSRMPRVRRRGWCSKTSCGTSPPINGPG